MEDRGAWALASDRACCRDGFDGAVGPGADLDGPRGGGLDARPKGADEPDDADTLSGSNRFRRTGNRPRQAAN
jgi:hypothetical protein